jgi:hypothetical protein
MLGWLCNCENGVDFLFVLFFPTPTKADSFNDSFNDPTVTAKINKDTDFEL